MATAISAPATIFRAVPAGRRRSQEALGAASAVADSPDEVRMRTREQLFQGASQIKLTAGGGVSSPHSPLDVVAFTEPELRAATEAATNWGTYVTVHAYTPATITAGDPRGRASHRTCAPDGRRHRES